jgi:hypothetical protein
MRETVYRLLLLLAITSTALPRVAHAGDAGCVRRDRQLTEAALIFALVATAAALVFRRRRIDWR